MKIKNLVQRFSCISLLFKTPFFYEKTHTRRTEPTSANTKTLSQRYQREKAASNKTPAPTNSMNINIWIVRASNQLFIRDLQKKIKCSK